MMTATMIAAVTATRRMSLLKYGTRSSMSIVPTAVAATLPRRGEEMLLA